MYAYMYIRTQVYAHIFTHPCLLTYSQVFVCTAQPNRFSLLFDAVILLYSTYTCLGDLLQKSMDAHPGQLGHGFCAPHSMKVLQLMLLQITMSLPAEGAVEMRWSATLGTVLVLHVNRRPLKASALGSHHLKSLRPHWLKAALQSAQLMQGSTRL